MTRFGTRRFVLPSLALTVASFALAPSAQARSRLLDDDPQVFAQEPADGGNGAADPATTRRVEERRRANDGDWFRAPMQQQAGHEDFPSNELHDAIEANTRAATARAMYRRAESSLNAVVRNAQRDFDRSAELREALAAEQRAYDALQAARREALRDVVENPKYQALQDLRSNLSEKIADRREGARDGLRDTATTAPATRLVSTAELPPRYELSRDRDGDVVAIATLKLRVGTDARSMERDALDGNDKIRRAREDLASASAKVTDLRDKFDDSLRNNDDMKQARGELEEARIARVTTATYLLGAREAAEEALQFAYWVHRYDYNRYNYPYYGQYPYGYGHHSYGVGYRPSRMVP